MEAFSLCSWAQAAELALTPRSCSRMAEKRAPARSKSSRSKTTQWSHTEGTKGSWVSIVGMDQVEVSTVGRDPGSTPRVEGQGSV